MNFTTLSKPIAASLTNERTKTGTVPKAAPSAPTPSGFDPREWANRIEDHFRHLADSVADFFANPCIGHSRTGTLSTYCTGLLPPEDTKPAESVSGKTELKERSLSLYFKITMGMLLSRSEDNAESAAGFRMFFEGLENLLK